MSLLKNLFSPAYGYVRTLTCIALGLVLVIWPDIAARTIIMAIGALLIVVGGVSVGLSFKGSSSFGNLMSFSGIFDILFGLVLIIFTDFFISLIMYVFGFFFILFGVSQISNLISASRYAKISMGYYILPALVSLGGFALFFKPFLAQETIFIFTGFCLIAYGLSELLATIKVNKVYKAQSDIEESQYEEVSSESLEEIK